MSEQEKSIDTLVYELKERAKELNCLYAVQGILNKPGLTTQEVCGHLVEIIPAGWQYPNICQAFIQVGADTFRSSNYAETLWDQSADILVQDEVIGKISVGYQEEMPVIDEGPFLREERRLINTIADLLGNYILGNQLKSVFEKSKDSEVDTKGEWWVILDLLRRTNPKLLIQLARRMTNYLYWKGIKQAEQLFEYFSSAYKEDREIQDLNYPYQTESESNAINIVDDVFELAGEHLEVDEILSNIQQWIREDQSNFLVSVLVTPGSSLSDISSAMERYKQLSLQGLELSEARENSVQTSLIRRLLSDKPDFVNIAKQYLEIENFYGLLDHLIHPIGSYGMLGGKGAGIFLASQILNKAAHENDIIKRIKTPKTWYIASDAIFRFMDYNGLEDFLEHKYLDMGQIQQEYPYLVHVFKNSPMPPEILKELSLVLDDFGDVPLIIRSSSILEDQVGMSFAGKYKSLFISNQGTKEERLHSLIDAIAEVYASMFGPDPIKYRTEHGLLYHSEAMGILIQEVVGKRIGRYFFPAYAGVAFSQNEFRWSGRIKREDGLVRLVPGLGTRAVDRLSNDYPVLVSPGQPGLRVNVSVEEIARYSPKMIDVINLDDGSFDTIDIRQLLKEYGDQYPNIQQLISIITHDYIKPPNRLGTDFEKDNFIVTFDGLLARTPFLKLIQTILFELEDKFEHPVDIEFACDGEDFYLLQCRSQSYSLDHIPAEIPTNIPKEKILFTANRYISNGVVSDITHIVYIDPNEYSQISNRQDLLSVGRAVGQLNEVLPKRKFILMGPGRWGSRGDIKLGVNVTYADIDNTAALIEVANQQGDYIPDLSFGTHFFQDLVEASIRYLPLYPDDYGIVFQREFFTSAENSFSKLVPDLSYLEKVIHVIDIPQETGGQVVNIFMNSDQDKAAAILSDEKHVPEVVVHKRQIPVSNPKDMHWQWRLRSVETLAAYLDSDRFGVEGFYIFGSVQNATAGPQSDIDLLIHFDGTENQREDLLTWLDGWSRSLSLINYDRTGYKTDGLLDIHIITNEDIEKRTSYALKIGAKSDAARPLKVGGALKKVPEK